jgi:hypothetical protein
MLRARISSRCGWLLAALAGALLAGCGGNTPTSGPDKAAPPADKKPADKDKDGKPTPPPREIG